MRYLFRFSLFFVLLICSSKMLSQAVWGCLANPGFESQYIKSTYFFAGNWRNGVQFYEYNPSDNTGLYTLHPSDSRHLGWSENVNYRTFAVNSMIETGVNVINMSYWGTRGTDNWAYWAPMQTSTYAHDQLFEIALDKHILVAPYIESYAATTNCDGFSFMDDFPGSASDPAPQLITLIEDLVDRYLSNPDNARWPEVWARAYDQDGEERYLISIIHVASNQAGVNDQQFAEGFDLVADSIYNATGFRIGFLLDILPVATYSPGSYKLEPGNADTWLVDQKSILGVQCFIPEIWTGFDNDSALVAWKRDYCHRWSNTSVPFIIDVSPGYDAHVVFPSSLVYGNNQAWRDSLTAIAEDIPADGITVNTWNGYTEGFAAVPTLEYGSASYSWVSNLYEMYALPEPSVATHVLSIDMVQIDICPNPFSSGTTITYYIRSRQKVILKMIDLQGREVAVLVNEVKQPGEYAVEFNSAELPNGMYYYQLIAEEIIQSRKCSILR
jgi:hypothetical protein